MVGEDKKIPRSAVGVVKITEEDVERELSIMSTKRLFEYISKNFEIANFVLDHPKLAERRCDDYYAAFAAIESWPDLADRVASEDGLYYIIELKSNDDETGRSILEDLGVEIRSRPPTVAVTAKDGGSEMAMPADAIGKIIAGLKRRRLTEEERLVEQITVSPISELLDAIRNFENIANLVAKHPKLANRWSEKEGRFAAHASVEAWPSSGWIAIENQVVYELVDEKDITVLELALKHKEVAKAIATDERYRDLLTFDLGKGTVVDVIYDNHGIRATRGLTPLKWPEVDSKIGGLKRTARTGKNVESEKKVDTLKMK